jgi:hypothetical protein
VPLPKKLFKFRQLDEKTISIIVSNVIYFASPDQFNDPFDCRLRFIHDFSPSEWEVFLTEQMRKYATNLSEEQIAASVKQRMDERFYESPLFLDFLYDMVLAQVLPRTGVLSLAEKSNNILMWSHYADSHKGCVLEFSTKEDRVFGNAQPVVYHETYPKLDFRKCIADANTFVEAMLLSKSAFWKYEKEWRTLGTDGPGLYKFSPSALTGIILGHQMPQEHRDLISKLVSTHNPSIDLYRAFPHHREFDMEILPYK